MVPLATHFFDWCIPVYFCVGRVTSRPLRYKLWAALWEKDVGSDEEFWQNDTVTLRHLRGKVTFLTDRCYLTLPYLISCQPHSAKWSSIYTLWQVIKGTINCNFTWINHQLSNWLSCFLFLCAFVQWDVCSAYLHFSCLLTNLEWQMAQWCYPVFSRHPPVMLWGLFGQDLWLM